MFGGFCSYLCNFSREEPLPPGWQRAALQIEGHGQIIRIVDLDTKLCYLDEPLALIAGKSALLFTLLPMATASLMGYQLFRSVFLVLTYLNHGIAESVEQGNREPALRGLYEAAMSVAEATFRVLKAPFYCVAMQVSALVAIFWPLQGRAWVASIEKAWRGFETQKDDIFRYATPEETDQACTALLTDRNARYLFIFAYCFQPSGTTTDPRVRRVTPLPDKRSFAPLGVEISAAESCSV